MARFLFAFFTLFHLSLTFLDWSFPLNHGVELPQNTKFQSDEP